MMFERIKGLLTGAGEAIGVEIPADFTAVTDAVAQFADAPGVADVVDRVTEPSP